MEHQIKALATAITHEKLKKLVQSHVKELLLEGNHLIIFVGNTAQLHELSLKSMDEHLKKALEKVYDPKTTYEFRIFHHIHEKSDHVEIASPKKRNH